MRKDLCKKRSLSVLRTTRLAEALKMSWTDKVVTESELDRSLDSRPHPRVEIDHTRRTMFAGREMEAGRRTQNGFHFENCLLLQRRREEKFRANFRGLVTPCQVAGDDAGTAAVDLIPGQVEEQETTRWRANR